MAQFILKTRQLIPKLIELAGCRACFSSTFFAPFLWSIPFPYPFSVLVIYLAPCNFFRMYNNKAILWIWTVVLDAKQRLFMFASNQSAAELLFALSRLFTVCANWFWCRSSTLRTLDTQHITSFRNLLIKQRFSACLHGHKTNQTTCPTHNITFTFCVRALRAPVPFRHIFTHRLCTPSCIIPIENSVCSFRPWTRTEERARARATKRKSDKKKNRHEIVMS